MPDVIDDLEAEHDEFEALLGELSPDDWTSPSAAAGWSMADVVLHLAQTEEAIPAALAGESEGVDWRAFGDDVDTAMDAMVRSESATPADVFERWRVVRRLMRLYMRHSTRGARTAATTGVGNMGFLGIFCRIRHCNRGARRPTAAHGNVLASKAGSLT